MRRFGLVCLQIVLFSLMSSGCTHFSSQGNEKWIKYQDDFFSDLWLVYPQWAFAVGNKHFAGNLKVPSKAYRNEQKEFYLKYQQRLVMLPKNTLSPSEKTDYELVKNFLQAGLWELDVLKSYQWDPSQANLGSALSGIFENASMTGSEKLNAIFEKLKKLPDYYRASFEQLVDPTEEHLQLALRQHRSLVSYLEKQFLDQALDLTTQLEQKKQLRELVSQATQSVRDYVTSLQIFEERLRKEHKFRNPRLGAKIYGEKFKLDLQSSFTAEEIYRKAVEQKKKTHEEMLKISQQLWPLYFGKRPMPKNTQEVIRKVLHEISLKHTTADQFVATIRQQIPQLWKFVEEKNLLTLDPKKPLVVRETPPFNRGFAGAGVNAPGPYDDKRETYYEVTPLDGMSAEKQESYLREYNDYTLQILNIHEAVPGHYTQLVYSLQSPSLVKKILGSGTMVEGWAVYAERMMLEEGYGGQKPEMWLMYYKWRLRVICNTILDYSLHTQDWNKKQAMDLLLNEAFQEKAEAEEKWNRATYSQVQLASYFTGFTEIYEFREELKQKEGSSFDLKKFHENFLSYGSAPIYMIRELMTEKK